MNKEERERAIEGKILGALEESERAQERGGRGGKKRGKKRKGDEDMLRRGEGRENDRKVSKRGSKRKGDEEVSKRGSKRRGDEKVSKRVRQKGSGSSKQNRQIAEKGGKSGAKMSDESRQARNILLKIDRRHPWIKMMVIIVMIAGLGIGASFVEVLLAGGQKQGKVEMVSEEQAGGAIDEVEIGDEGGGEIKEERNDGGDGAGQEDVAKEDVTKGDVMEEDDGRGVQTNNDLIPPAVTEGKMLIALTFDDGPSAETTGRLLDILKEKQARATFFVLGTRAQANPDLVQRQIREGHEVGTHSLWHANLGTMGWDAVAADLAEAKGILRNITGMEPTLLRPPYGSINDAVLGMGMPVITWTVDPDDWRDKDLNTVHWRVCEYAFDGAIVLMHDIYDSTVDAMSWIIDDLRGRGYELVTVSELAAAKGASLAPGVVYGKF